MFGTTTYYQKCSVCFFSLFLGGMVFFPIPTFAGNFEWDWFGLTVRTSNKMLIPDQKPKKIDTEAHVIWNPGLGIGYDYRPFPKTEGCFPIVKAGFFQSDQDSTLGYIAGGYRWRFCIAPNFYIDAVCGMALMLRQVYVYDEQIELDGKSTYRLNERTLRLAPVPLLSLGIGTTVFSKLVHVNFTTFNPLSGLLLFVTAEL